MKPLVASVPLLSLLSEAIDALRENLLRTILSLLGVAIGIASLIAVGSISSSGRDIIFKELETFGLRTFWVFREYQVGEILHKDAGGSGITTADYREMLRLGAPLARISPVVEFSKDKISAINGDRQTRIRLQGVNSEYADIDGDELETGRFFTTSDVLSHTKVAVIGPSVRERLFPDGADPIGRRVAIDESWFTIVGTLKAKSRDVISSLSASRGEDTNARVLVPFTTAQKMINDGDFVSYLQGQSSEINASREATEVVIRLLTIAHGRDYHYKSESMSTYVDTANRILGTVGLIGIVAASVSLLVGGLAIMNIMTTSVIERTQEIGLRRAIGATKVAIRLQFLAESILISCAGGLAGVVIGLAIVAVISHFSSQPITPLIGAIILATISTFLVGIVSGFYPAQRAANLAPVEALKHA